MKLDNSYTFIFNKYIVSMYLLCIYINKSLFIIVLEAGKFKIKGQ